MGVRQSFLQPRLGHVAHLVWVDYCSMGLWLNFWVAFIWASGPNLSVID